MVVVVFGEKSSAYIPRLLFADEPFKMYEGVEIDIRMIRAVAVDYGSAKKTIPDVSKTFSFVGDGTATEVYREGVPICTKEGAHYIHRAALGSIQTRGRCSSRR